MPSASNGFAQDKTKVFSVAMQILDPAPNIPEKLGSFKGFIDVLLMLSQKSRRRHYASFPWRVQTIFPGRAGG